MPKKAKGPEMEAPVETSERVVRLALPPASHRILRLIAAEEDLSMAEYIRALVMKTLDHEAKARGIKG